MRRLFWAVPPLILAVVMPLVSQGDRGETSEVVRLFEAVGRSDTSQLGLNVLGAGDQNHDGFADIIASARGERKVYLFYGGSPMDTTPDMVFSNSLLAALADVNGDSTKDFIFGAFGPPPGSFYAKLYYGGNLLDTTADLEFHSSDAGDGFGPPYSIGDFNGDGFEDIAISALAFPNGQYQGKVTIFLGGSPMDSIADWSVYGDSAEYYFGTDVTGGDLNSDGYSDIIVSGYRFRWSGSPAYIKVYFGGNLPDTIPDLILEGTQVNFPISPYIKTVEDVNLDGYADLCMNIGGERDTAAYIFLGGNPFNLIPDVVLQRTHAPGDFQPTYNQSSAGDINKDGYGDIILGNPNCLSGFGEVLVYLGGQNMSSNFALGFTGLGNPFDGAGIAVGKSGDVNGDLVDDIMFGAWNGSPGSNNYPGRVEIFSGDSTITGVTELGNDQPPKTFHLYPNYPNPFNGKTTITFSVPSVGSLSLVVHVSLSIFDIQGKMVRTLINEEALQTGDHAVQWDATDARGQAVGSGIYLYRLTVNSHALTNKMVVLR